MGQEVIFSNVAGWQKNSFIDYPGKIATVIFLGHCNLQCPYCHNPSIIRNPPKGLSFGEDIIRYLSKNKTFIDGVVITGGEPTLYKNLPQLVNFIRSLGYPVKLDTNGLNPDRIKEVSPDYLALDIKSNPQGYKNELQCTYPDIHERLSQSVQYLKTKNDNGEVRVTLAPKIVTPEVLTYIKELCAGVKKVYLQRLRLTKGILEPNYFSNLTEFSLDDIENIHQNFKENFPLCIVR